MHVYLANTRLRNERFTNKIPGNHQWSITEAPGGLPPNQPGKSPAVLPPGTTGKITLNTEIVNFCPLPYKKEKVLYLCRAKNKKPPIKPVYEKDVIICDYVNCWRYPAVFLWCKPQGYWLPDGCKSYLLKIN